MIDGHRKIWFFSGNRTWAIQCIKDQLPSGYDSLWITDQTISSSLKTVSAEQAFLFLGQEVDAVIFDAFAGFNLDAFGIVAGLVRGGGSMILLIPPLSQWKHYPDNEYRRLFNRESLPYASLFIQRMAEKIKKNFSSQIIETDRSLPVIFDQKVVNLENMSRHHYADGSLTREQSDIVQRIKEQCCAHESLFIVLTAHRGRGKTSTLGLIISHLMADSQRFLRLVVTAPRKEATLPLFHCAKKHQYLLNAPIVEPPKSFSYSLRLKGGEVSFKAPDHVIRFYPMIDILFVDEAAAIPLPLLEKLCMMYSRIVFCTTEHGYEGTGQGFSIQFKKKLSSYKKKVVYYQLTQSLRWRENDALENFFIELSGAQLSQCSKENLLSGYESGFLFRTMDRYDLSNTLLQDQIFQLLMVAHYQTKPSDFRFLLDYPDKEIFVLQSQAGNHILAAAIVFYEGPIPKEEHQDILLGKRRRRGDLFPQLLATQNHVPSILCARGIRIQRIAVHPALHNKGLGSYLLCQIKKIFLKKKQYDYIGSSFGLTKQRLCFWKKNKFFLTGIGTHTDASSSLYSASVFYSLSSQGTRIFRQAQKNFSDNFPYLLREGLPLLETDVCFIVCQQIKVPSLGQRLSQQDKEILQAYTNGYRLHHYVLATLTRIFWFHTGRTDFLQRLSEQEKKLIMMKIAKNNSWESCIEHLKLSGKKEAIALLRQCYKKLLSH